MKKIMRSLALAACLILPACAVAEEGALRTVTRVFDGDTIQLENGEKVRLIGVDTPEIHDDDGRNAAHASRFRKSEALIDEFSEKAKDFTERAVLGRKVRLEYDWERRDKFGRTLAYVYRDPDGFFLNAEILMRGCGFAYTRFPFKYRDEFRSYEEGARRGREGLWR